MRGLVHNPEKILKPFVSEGDVVADVGCGMGFFSFGLASLVGSSGHVYAINVQPKMLEVLNSRRQKFDSFLPITSVLVSDVDQHVQSPIDFLLTFWMLHEVDDKTFF